ncbi:unnamed protein product [Prunus armeniaca]
MSLLITWVVTGTRWSSLRKRCCLCWRIDLVCWARIPFLPLHYEDPEVLHDLVSILVDPITIDLPPLEGKQSMFMRARL